jgi:hypothetical protein
VHEPYVNAPPARIIEEHLLHADLSIRRWTLDATWQAPEVPVHAFALVVGVEPEPRFSSPS